LIKVYRICRLRYAAFDGEGSRRKSGRWNFDGVPVVYTAGSLSLAALEVLAHSDPSILPEDLVYIEAEIPKGIAIAQLQSLPKDWQEIPAPNSTKALGNRWVQDAKTAVIAVPSSLIRIETNYLINPLHPDFKKIKVQKPVKFNFDSRLL
jgi:RES domain-containing protein